jgi:hypothetical protein
VVNSRTRVCPHCKATFYLKHGGGGGGETQSQNDNVNVANSNATLVGAVVRKLFRKEFHLGLVMSYDPTKSWLWVTFQDHDCEEMTLWELKGMVREPWRVPMTRKKKEEENEPEPEPEPAAAAVEKPPYALAASRVGGEGGVSEEGGEGGAGEKVRELEAQMNFVEPRTTGRKRRAPERLGVVVVDGDVEFEEEEEFDDDDEEEEMEEEEEEEEEDAVMVVEEEEEEAEEEEAGGLGAQAAAIDDCAELAEPPSPTAMISMQHGVRVVWRE